MTSFRIASDFHLEFYQYQSMIGSPSRDIYHTSVLPIMENEKDQILILAGDIITAARISKRNTEFGILYASHMDAMLDALSARFKAIVIIAGNHEYYKSTFELVDNMLKTYYAQWNNIYYLQNSHAVFDGIEIFGSTFWTNFNNNPSAELYANGAMSDFYVINSRGGRFTASQSVSENNLALFNLHEWTKQTEGKKRVIVTHHSPSFQGIAPRFKGSMLNYAFHNNLDEYIREIQPELWIHGHTHINCDYMIDKTRVLCNPYGYYSENPKGYIGKLVVEI